MNKKAEMKPKDYLIGLIIFGLTITAIMTMISFMGSDIKADTTEFNQTFNILSNVTSRTNSMSSGLSSDVNEGTFGFLDFLIKSSYNTAKLLLTNFTFIDTMLRGLTGFFGVPIWFIEGIIAIIVLIIVFALMRAVMQTDQL